MEAVREAVEEDQQQVRLSIKFYLATLSKRIKNPTESGQCSWYGADGEFRPDAKTANGNLFNRNAYTAAHKTLPFGTRIRVKNHRNGKTVDVVINDRGPFTPGRIVDLTYAAFGVIDNRDAGVVPCSYVKI